MPEGAKAVMHHLKLDSHGERRITRCFYTAPLPWTVRKTLPQIDEYQKLALLHAPFKGTTLFGGELAKLQEANMKRVATFAVFPTPTAPPVSYSSRPYVGRGKRLADRKGPKKPSGRGRPMPTATIARPGQAKEGQPPVTASTPEASNKCKVEPWDYTSQIPRKNKRHF